MSPSGLIFQQELDKWKASTAPIVRLYKKVDCLHVSSSLHTNNLSVKSLQLLKGSQRFRQENLWGIEFAMEKHVGQKYHFWIYSEFWLETTVNLLGKYNS